MSDARAPQSRLEKDLQKLTLSFKQKAGKKQFESRQAQFHAETLAAAHETIVAQKKEIEMLQTRIEALEKQVPPKPDGNPQP